MIMMMSQRPIQASLCAYYLPVLFDRISDQAGVPSAAPPCTVWRGSIKNFKFNTPFDQDPVCKRAVEAVITSSVKFRRARTYLWFWSLLDHELFKRTGYGPMDNWPGTVESVEYNDLQNKGYRVKLVPVKWANYCMLEICGHEVFRCNLKNLKFNTCVKRDVIAQRAIEAVLVCSSMLRRARAYLWFWSLIDHQLFRRTKFGPQDYFLTNADHGRPFASPRDCVKCCVPPTYVFQRLKLKLKDAPTKWRKYFLNKLEPPTERRKLVLLSRTFLNIKTFRNYTLHVLFRQSPRTQIIHAQKPLEI
ncbi:unnamed protein product [Spodoptera littoralis]|uniref:Uncharacterized protein n=1 Tax=Spodoptera littoralis TaxID=7109 RepID=A0A9P0N466_SPOLI|nr:unnamed protein product [Spodoptera littoralis]CAH1644117.1 unnamed protein product [Spodoptera littoralis]